MTRCFVDRHATLPGSELLVEDLAVPFGQQLLRVVRT
jgi:hypothetical protein